MGIIHIITFTGTQIALILSQTGQATVASCPGPSVWLLQTSVAITSLIPFYEILFYPITNLIQEWLAKREWMAATPRWTSGSSKASNGSSMSCRRNPRGGKVGSLEEQHLVNTWNNVLGRRRLYLDICVIGVEASSAHSNQAYVPIYRVYQHPNKLVGFWSKKKKLMEATLNGLYMRKTMSANKNHWEGPVSDALWHCCYFELCTLYQ